jgi:prepilin-type processing-associated H-X9-DG protein/prepilin-type N-terminal cleavage/methylation domain-containing protein
MTLIELLIVIAIVAILAAIAIPTINGARQKAVEAKCISNLRQIGIAFQGYLSEHDNTYPDSIGGGSSGRWVHALDDYVGADGQGYATEVFHCPRTPKAQYTTTPGGNAVGLYGFNDYVAGSGNARARRKIVQIRNPSRLVIMAEHAFDRDAGAHLSPDDPYPKSPRGAAANHQPGKTPAQAAENGRGNYLYADGHVETLSVWPGRDAFDPSR